MQKGIKECQYRKGERESENGEGKGGGERGREGVRYVEK